MKYTHWFWSYTDSDGFRIHTQGSGNHPAGKYWYETKENLDLAIKCFVNDGYKYMGHNR